jgi:hypothetical protein
MSELTERLRERGFAIDPPRPGDPVDGAIVARRDWGDRAIVFSADAGGRFRVEITWLVGEWPSRQEIAGVPVRIVDSVTRSVTITGTVAQPERLTDVIDGLDAVVPWATGDGEPPREESADRV